MKKIGFMMMTLLLLTTALTINLVLAGGTNKGDLGTAQTIDIYDLSTWDGVENITDATEDNLNQTVTNVTDITNVWMCNNYTYLFVRVDVAENFTDFTGNFAIQLYVEDANGTVAGNDTLLYTNAPDIEKNDINATYLFSVWSNGTFYRYNFSDTEWTMDVNLTDTAAADFNWTRNSFVMMINLTLLSSTGEIYTGNSFKFEVFTAFEDESGWLVADYLDYGTYTITGEVIPEFPNVFLMTMLLFFAGFLLAATKKLKLFR